MNSESKLKPSSSATQDSTRTKVDVLMELAQKSQAYWDMCTYAGCLKHNEMQKEVKKGLGELTPKELAEFILRWLEYKVGQKKIQDEYRHEPKKIARSK